MKKILPMVVNPVKRCGVAARSRLMPEVDSGTVNPAHDQLSYKVRLRERTAFASLVDCQQKASWPSPNPEL